MLLHIVFTFLYDCSDINEIVVTALNMLEDQVIKKILDLAHQQEKYVIVFLIVGAICGLSYSYYKKFNPPINIWPRPAAEKSARHSEELDNLIREEKTVNINEASAKELMRLKGVGPVLAHRIIEYRTTQGLFKDTSELKKISGVGPKKFDAIKDYITTE